MKGIKRMAAAFALAATIASPASAQIRGSLEHIASSESRMSYERANAFYKAPGGVDGYTFGELYGSGKGYYFKTSLSRKAGKGLCVRAEMQSANEPFTRAGMGLGYNLPMPKGSYASVKYMPAWFGKDGHDPERSIVGYAAGAKIAGFDVSSFGEINIAAKGGPKWAYGEAKVSKTFKDRYEIGYNPALRGKGGAKPRLEHRVNIGVKF